MSRINQVLHVSLAMTASVFLGFTYTFAVGYAFFVAMLILEPIE